MTNDDIRAVAELVARQHAAHIEMLRELITRSQSTMDRLTDAILESVVHNRVCKPCQAEKVFTEIEPPVIQPAPNGVNPLNGANIKKGEVYQEWNKIFSERNP